MSSYYQKPSETQPLLEEHVETGQDRLERHRALKNLYFFIAVITCIVIFGAGLIIGINFSSIGKYGDI